MKKFLLLLALVLAPVSAWGQTTTTMYRVNNIAALKAIPTSRPPVVIVMDLATGGEFAWGTTPCAAADDLYQVTPTAGPTGCWTRIKSLVEAVSAVSITDNILTINLSGNATVYTTTSNANITTFTISNAPAGATAFTLVLTANGSTYTQAWGASVKWPSAAAPVLSTTNGVYDVISFVTFNGGTTWSGFVGGQAFQ